MYLVTSVVLLSNYIFGKFYSELVVPLDVLLGVRHGIHKVFVFPSSV